MTRFHNVLSLLLVFVTGAAFYGTAQTNLIANGNFASDSGWNDLGLYNNGAATKLLKDSSYSITVTKPGSERWSVQLAQPHIRLINGNAYLLSFEASASLERSIEVTLSRNGGDYVSYSGKKLAALSMNRRKMTYRFIMKQPTDNDARLEINCGMENGTVALYNVSLVQFTDKVIECESPAANELVPAGKPYPVSWTSVNVAGRVAIGLSIDNGSTWSIIATAAVDSGPYIWIPRENNAPWCRIKIASIDSPQVFALNAGVFEIAPVRELLRNGTFTNSSNDWNLGQHGGKAEALVTGYGAYELSILEKGGNDWNIQVVQDRIPLVKGQRYRCSFQAFAETTVTIDVNIGMNYEPYGSYLDSAQRYIALSSTPTYYSFVFVMRAATDSSARFELNCGKATGTLVFDNLSLVPEYTVAVYGKNSPQTSRVMSGKRVLPYGVAAERWYVRDATATVWNLAGRKLSPGHGAAVSAAGVYIVKSLPGVPAGEASR